MLAAKGVSIDKYTNMSTIYNIIENLHSDSFPIFFPEIYVFVLLERKESEERNINCVLKIYNNGKEINSIKVNPQFKTSNRNRTVIRVNGITILSPGKLLFKFIYDNRTLGHYNILLTKTGITKSNIIDTT
jgi:hypothetical protein